MEEDLCYLLQPSRMYIGDNINVFGQGSLVMERPGSAPCHTVGKLIIYGGVHGTIGVCVCVCVCVCGGGGGGGGSMV